MPDDATTPVRDYCYLLDSRKYNRNRGCQLHDNAYGIAGGGGERDRWRFDVILYRRMSGERDPMALPTLLGCLALGGSSSIIIPDDGFGVDNCCDGS